VDASGQEETDVATFKDKVSMATVCTDYTSKRV